MIVTYANDNQLNTIHTTTSVLYTTTNADGTIGKAIVIADQAQLEKMQSEDIATTVVKTDPSLESYTVFYHPDIAARVEIGLFGKIWPIFDNYTLVEKNTAMITPPTDLSHIYFETPLAREDEALPNPFAVSELRFQNEEPQDVSSFNFTQQSEPTLTPYTTLSPNTPTQRTGSSDNMIFTVIVIVCMVIAILLFIQLVKKNRHG